MVGLERNIGAERNLRMVGAERSCWNLWMERMVGN
jgi:hypothetical protein